MVHKLAILIGGIGATAVLALALGVTGLFSPAPAAQTAQVADVAAVSQPQVQADAPTVKKVIDKVYVAPTPDAPVVHVNKPGKQPAEPPAATTPRRNAPGPAVQGPRGERDDERSHGDDSEPGGDEGPGGDH